ncbi:hypothetical protein Taro_047759, partial [Colocasia esculenta]|nr:hypothetical protein [Colocasia esculenta]
LRRRQGKDTPATPSSSPYPFACLPRCRASPADPIAFFLLRFGAGDWPLPWHGPPPPVLAEAVPPWSAFCGGEGRLIAEGESIMSKLTADWFSREEYEKFREDLQRKRIHIDAQSASTSKDSLAGRKVRILNFSGQVVVSGFLMSDDNDNVVMGKKLGGEYYEKEEGEERKGKGKGRREVPQWREK